MKPWPGGGSGSIGMIRCIRFEGRISIIRGREAVLVVGVGMEMEGERRDIRCLVLS